jgi:hypothetical protein
VAAKAGAAVASMKPVPRNASALQPDHIHENSGPCWRPSDHMGFIQAGRSENVSLQLAKTRIKMNQSLSFDLSGYRTG